MIIEGQYVDAKLDGEVIHRYQDGSIGERLYYEKGKLARVEESKNPDGSDKPFGFKNGTGIFTPFNASQVQVYSDGKKTVFPIYGFYKFNCANYTGMNISKTGQVTMYVNDMEGNNWSTSTSHGSDGSMTITAKSPHGGVKPCYVILSKGWENRLMFKGWTSVQVGFSYSMGFGIGCHMSWGQFYLQQGNLTS